MLLLLIFPILAAGFFACHIHPVHSYKLHRYEGQYLYLKSAEMGLKCFALAFLICLCIYLFVPSSLKLGCFDIPTSIPRLLADTFYNAGIINNKEALKLSWFFILSTSTFAAAYIIKGWALISLRQRYGEWNTKIYVIGSILEDSPLDNLLFNLSLHKDKYGMFTMTNNKVYVGKVINLGEPTETDGMNQGISIMPLLSGYRDKDTLKIKFTTDYKDGGSDIYLALRQDAILSVSEFSFDAYMKWNPKKKSFQKSLVAYFQKLLD